ncbi:hypothetical protein MHYP_G00121530 [Metynnis hypsauchen]
MTATTSEVMALWSRCFPVYTEVGRLHEEDAVGDVKLVKAYFDSPQLHIARKWKWKQSNSSQALIQRGLRSALLR